MAAAAAAYEAAISGADKGWLASAAGVSAAVGLAKQHSDQGWQSWAHSRGLPCVPTSTPPPSRDLAAGLERTLFALALSEEALALAPRCARAHTAVAACCGRLALYSEDPRQRVRLANRIRASAEAALALDAREDGAHHVLARWHLELSQLNPVLRALVRHVLRGDTDASAEAALAHYSAAVAIAPARLVHRAELGKALLRLGRRREALVNLRAALSCEPEDVNAAMSRLHVQTIVNKMRRQERRMQREEQRAAAKARQEERRAAVRLERVARREARREAREARSSPARRGEADTAAATSS